MKDKKKYYVILCLIYFLTGCASINQEKMMPMNGEDIPPALYPVYFFRNYISNADGSRCPMYPSCSSYCMESLKKHGALKGWMLCCDRLLRCGRDELKRCPRIEISSEAFCFDPVTNNDFWW